MALQTSGAISINDLHVEAGGTTGTLASMNDADIRDLISKTAGAQMSLSEWYGASADSGVTEMLGGTKDDFAHIVAVGTYDDTHDGETGSGRNDPADWDYAPRWSANAVLDPATDEIGYQRYSYGDRNFQLAIDTSNNRLRARTPNTVYSDVDNDGTNCWGMVTLNRFLPGYYRIEGNGLQPSDSNCPSSNTIYVWAFDDSFNTVTGIYGARELTDATPVLLGNANIPAGTTDRGFNFTVTSGHQNLVLIIKCYYAPTTQNGVSSTCRSGITNLDIYEDTP